MAEASSGSAWEFDGFTMLTEMRVLLRQGVAVPLTSKAFDTLAILVANRDRVVTKDELLRSVWPDVVVEEGNLTQQIFLLRKALGETAQQPRYIVTVPGHGYRFTARLKVGSGDAVSPPAVVASGGWKSIGRGHLIAGLAVLATVLGLSWRARDRGSPPMDLSKARVTKITESGKAIESAASTDGRYIAYVEDDGDQQSVWVKHTGGGGPTMVVPQESTVFANLTFSVDGDSLYFTRLRRPDLFVLSRVPVIGGVESPVLEDVDTQISFSPEGGEFAFARGTQTGVDLVVASASGESSRTLARLKNPLGFDMVAPDWSADGKSLAAVALEPMKTGPRWSIQQVSIVDGTATELFTTYSRIGRIRWAPDGYGVLAVISEALTRQFPPWHARHFRFSGGPIWRIYEGRAEQLTSDLVDHDLCCLDLAKNGTEVTSVINSLFSDLWIAPADDLSARIKITSGAPTVTRHAWLRDNETIVYRDLSGRLNAVKRDQRTSSFSLPDGMKVAGGVSACGDGRYVVFQGVPGNHIWRIPVNGGAARELTRGSFDSNPACSPDGTWVMYSSSELQLPSVSRVSIEGREPAPLAPLESYDALPSPSGRRMYYSGTHWETDPVRVRFGRWIITSLPGREPLFELDWPRNMTRGVPNVWAPDGNHLDYVGTTLGVSNVWRQPLTGERPTQLTDYNSGKIFSIAWSPNGRWLSMAHGANRSDVVTLSR